MKSFNCVQKRIQISLKYLRWSFLWKQSTFFSRWLFSQKTPSYMFYRILNTLFMPELSFWWMIKVVLMQKALCFFCIYEDYNDMITILFALTSLNILIWVFQCCRYKNHYGWRCVKAKKWEKTEQLIYHFQTKDLRLNIDFSIFFLKIITIRHWFD